MKALLQPVFVICVSLYLLVRVARLGAIELPILINSYLTDFLCMPIILTLSCIGVRFVKRLPSFHLNSFMIFGMTSFYALLFEYFLPNQNKIYSADSWDVVTYFSGALFYFQLQCMNLLAKVSVSDT